MVRFPEFIVSRRAVGFERDTMNSLKDHEDQYPQCQRAENEPHDL